MVKYYYDWIKKLLKYCKIAFEWLCPIGQDRNPERPYQLCCAPSIRGTLMGCAAYRPETQTVHIRLYRIYYIAPLYTYIVRGIKILCPRYCFAAASIVKWITQLVLSGNPIRDKSHFHWKSLSGRLEQPLWLFHIHTIDFCVCMGLTKINRTCGKTLQNDRLGPNPSIAVCAIPFNPTMIFRIDLEMKCCWFARKPIRFDY